MTAPSSIPSGTRTAFRLGASTRRGRSSRGPDPEDPPSDRRRRRDGAPSALRSPPRRRGGAPREARTRWRSAQCDGTSGRRPSTLKSERSRYHERGRPSRPSTFVHRAVVERRQRARTGRTRGGTSAGRVGHVDVPLVDAQLDAAQRGDGVGDHERVVVVRDVGQFGDVRLEDPGRGLRVNEPEHVRLVFVERALNIDRVEGFAHGADTSTTSPPPARSAIDFIRPPK